METPVLPTPASHPLWQHQFGLLLESTGEGIFGIDLDGHCMFINRAGAQMLGHEQAAVLGSNMHELTHHSQPDGSHCADTDCPIFNAFRRGLPCRIDTEVFRRRDGSAFAVAYSSHPIMDGAQVRGAVITFVDITERRRAADALQQAKDELGLRVEERHARTDRHVAAAAESLRPLHPGAEADLAAGVDAACALHHQGLVGERHLRDLHLLRVADAVEHRLWRGLGQARVAQCREYARSEAAAPRLPRDPAGGRADILTGMRISMGIAWLVIVAAEMLVGGTGIGYFVWNEWNNLSLTNVIFAIGVIGVVGVLLDLAFAGLQTKVTYVQ
jgi:PAS domain S-box-containing protein